MLLGLQDLAEQFISVKCSARPAKRLSTFLFSHLSLPLPCHHSAPAPSVRLSGCHQLPARHSLLLFCSLRVVPFPFPSIHSLRPLWRDCLLTFWHSYSKPRVVSSAPFACLAYVQMNIPWLIYYSYVSLTMSEAVSRCWSFEEHFSYANTTWV